MLGCSPASPAYWPQTKEAIHLSYWLGSSTCRSQHGSHSEMRSPQTRGFTVSVPQHSVQPGDPGSIAAAAGWVVQQPPPAPPLPVPPWSCGGSGGGRRRRGLPAVSHCPAAIRCQPRSICTADVGPARQLRSCLRTQQRAAPATARWPKAANMAASRRFLQLPGPLPTIACPPASTHLQVPVGSNADHKRPQHAVCPAPAH